VRERERERWGRERERSVEAVGDEHEVACGFALHGLHANLHVNLAA
jgi:hypothetical protein